MTDQQHPITPPPELVKQWRDLPEYTDGRRKMVMVTLSREKLLDIATQAARWGADQELEAMCKLLLEMDLAANGDIEVLRAARRFKPPSFKEQALKMLDDVERFTEGDFYIIRRALEQLDD